MTSTRRLALVGAVAIGAVAVPTIAFAIGGVAGLLPALVVLHLGLVLLVIRIWLSLDGSITQTDQRLRSEVANLTRRVDKDLPEALSGVDFTAFQRSALELVDQVRSEREETAARLLEHERRIWELHQETLRQVDHGLEVQKGELKRRHETTDRALDRKIRTEFAQLEALGALYYELRPPTPFPATRSWVASPDLLRHLYEHVRDVQPRFVLECGSGLSTVIMAYGLRAAGYGGRIVALEHLEEYAERTRRMLADHGLSGFAEVRFAPLRDLELEGEEWTWYEQDALPSEPIDLVFVDGPPGDTREHARYPAVPLLRDRLAPGARILLDDYGRGEEAEIAQRWVDTIDGLQLTPLGHEKGTALLTFAGANSSTNDTATDPSREPA